MTDLPIIIHGDSREVLRTFDDAAFDSVVCDPPYALVSIVKRFGSPTAAPTKGKDAYMRAARGFMGQQWDTGDTAFDPAFWCEVLRVMKPGAHLIAFGGTRTYHRMAVAIEDAGFDVRDMLQWLYGSGFPKSHDLSKAIDRAAGAVREVVGVHERTDLRKGNAGFRNLPGEIEDRGEIALTAPATEAAREWSGWGTALKPACEPIVLARKPLSEGTIAANVLEHGTGAINVDACRVEHDEECAPIKAQDVSKRDERIIRQALRHEDTLNLKPNGRWPANVVHDGSAEVVAGFPETQNGGQNGTSGERQGMFGIRKPQVGNTVFDGDSGSAARFFYTAKADADDRLGSSHPTVKPVDLMQWLVRLVTRKGGKVLDPFAGTGTTGEAAWREGMNATLIEREERFVADIKRRISLLDASATARGVAIVKAKDKIAHPGPLFEMEGDK